MSFSFRFENALTRFKTSSRETLSLLGRSIFTSFLKGFIGTSEAIVLEGRIGSKRSCIQRLAGAAQVESVRIRELQA